jgi:hypothetical protein
MPYAIQPARGGRLRSKPTYLFAVRTPSHALHHRLVAAARDDGYTVAQELSMLLDLRDQWHALTGADHPLATIAPVPVVVPLEPLPPPPPVRKPKKPQWRTRGTYNRGGEGVDWFVGPASAHLPGYYQRNLDQDTQQEETG